MKKKEIIILVTVFFTVMFISTISIYFIINKDKINLDNIKTSNVLKVGEYKLKYGLYKGIEEEYDYDTDTVSKKEITLTLSKDKINGQSYEIKGMSLYVNGYEMYKVVANNKIILLAGEGVEFEYGKK